MFNVRGQRQITNKYKGDFYYEITKKTLHLNYSEPKGDKQVVKSYSFNVNADTDDTKLKEVGDEIAKLVSKNIDNTTINTKSLI